MTDNSTHTVADDSHDATDATDAGTPQPVPGHTSHYVPAPSPDVPADPLLHPLRPGARLSRAGQPRREAPDCLDSWPSPAGGGSTAVSDPGTRMLS